MEQIQSQSFTNLEGSQYSNCTFKHCDFTGANLRNAQFIGCTFASCNFSNVKLDAARLQEVRFVDCKIIGAEFFKCNRTFFAVSFKECRMQYCNFSDLILKKIAFSGSKMIECHFTDANLQGADFTEVDLSGTNFHNCNLSLADFSSAINYTIDPRTNQLKKAKFSLPDAVGLLHGFEINIV